MDKMIPLSEAVLKIIEDHYVRNVRLVIQEIPDSNARNALRCG